MQMRLPGMPIIGVSCHSYSEPSPRSAVGQAYIDAIVAAGGLPLLIPLGLDEAGLATVYTMLDGLLLPGGEDVAPERYRQERHPRLGPVDEVRDELELTLADWALRDDLPMLGICRGIQVLAVAAGGTLYQDLASELPSSIEHPGRGLKRDYLSHEIDLAPGSMLGEMIGSRPAGVNSFHHQAVRDVPAGFLVSARSDDGVIEGIESTAHHFAVGVQCHPEGIWQTTAPRFAALFQAFVAAAAADNAEVAAV